MFKKILHSAILQGIYAGFYMLWVHAFGWSKEAALLGIIITLGTTIMLMFHDVHEKLDRLLNK